MTDKEYPGQRAGSALGPATTGWGWILAYGVLVILVGFLALFNPPATGLATGLLVGITLVIYGVSAVGASLSSLFRRARWIELLLGLFAIFAGVLTIFHPFAGTLSLVWLIGVWLFVSGIFEIVSVWRTSFDRAWRLVLGVLDIVLGGLLLFSGPVTGLVFIALCVGVSFLLRGAFLVVLALGLRRMTGA